MSNTQASAWWFRREFGIDHPPPADVSERILRAVLVCTNGDGKLAPAEREWVVGLAAMHGAEPALLERLRKDPATGSVRLVISHDDVASDFGRRAVVYYALCAAAADGELHEGEIATIHRMSAELDVTREVVEQLIALVRLEEGLRSMRMKLLAPAPLPF